MEPITRLPTFLMGAREPRAYPSSAITISVKSLKFCSSRASIALMLAASAEFIKSIGSKFMTQDDSDLIYFIRF